MTDRRKQNIPLPLIVIAVGVLVLIVVLFLTLGGAADDQIALDQVQQGKDYLASLEQKDPSVVKEIRKQIFQEDVAEQRETLTQQLLNGEVDPFSLFKDYALLGDSRAVGFWYRNFLDQDRVLADGGNTIRYIPGWYEELQELNPSYIFLCYGLNDCSIGFWSEGEDYAAEYIEYVQVLQEMLPEATIVVSSILPAQERAFKQSSRWKRIPDWNIALEKACEENGILFANCDMLYDEHSNLWDQDGIHFKEPLYPYWGSLLIVTALMGGLEYEG